MYKSTQKILPGNMALDHSPMRGVYVKGFICLPHIFFKIFRTFTPGKFSHQQLGCILILPPPPCISCASDWAQITLLVGEILINFATPISCLFVTLNICHPLPFYPCHHACRSIASVNPQANIGHSLNDISEMFCLPPSDFHSICCPCHIIDGGDSYPRQHLSRDGHVDHR